MNFERLLHERIESPLFDRRRYPWFLPTALKVYEYQLLAAELPNGAGIRALDLGCGVGLQSMLLADRGWDVTAIDPDPARIEKAERRATRLRHLRGRLTYRAAPIEDAGLPDDWFDVVVSFCVLEHIPDLERCLAEVRRVLKPGGTFHATVDCLGTVDDPELLERHQRDYVVYRLFDMESTPAYFEAQGFTAIRCRPIMTGEFAIKELRNGWDPTPPSLPHKWTAVHALRTEDRRPDRANAGLMLQLAMSAP